MTAEDLKREEPLETKHLKNLCLDRPGLNAIRGNSYLPEEPLKERGGERVLSLQTFGNSKLKIGQSSRRFRETLLE